MRRVQFVVGSPFLADPKMQDPLVRAGTDGRDELYEQRMMSRGAGFRCEPEAEARRTDWSSRAYQCYRILARRAFT